MSLKNNNWNLRDWGAGIWERANRPKHLRPSHEGSNYYF